MNKLKVRLYDTNFAHHATGSSVSSFPGFDIYPKFIEWIRDPNVYTDFAFFTENCFGEVDNCNAKYKFAWILEPMALVPNAYKEISQPSLYNKFDKVLTHDEDLLNIDPDKFFQYVFGGCWIKPNEQRCYSKTKNVCIIASHKNQLEGHRLRHDVISSLAAKHKIDVFGNGYNRFDQTVDILKNYRYCIVIENIRKPFWVTEKLIQCFRVGTIPIYWGTEFNDKIHFPDGFAFYRFSDANDLDQLLPKMTEELYNKEDEMINLNYDMADRYCVMEDWIYDWFLYPWLEERNLLKDTPWEKSNIQK